MIGVPRHQDIHAVSSFEKFTDTGGRQSEQPCSLLQCRRLGHRSGLLVKLIVYGSAKIPLPDCGEKRYHYFAQDEGDRKKRCKGTKNVYE